MTMSRELFLAILSMDSYNRGYSPGIKNLGSVGSQIGNVIISTDSTETPITKDVGQAAGFYAVAYTTAAGGKIISYRGTDQLAATPFSEFGSDVWNGYSLAGGGSDFAFVQLTPANDNAPLRTYARAG